MYKEYYKNTINTVGMHF